MRQCGFGIISAIYDFFHYFILAVAEKEDVYINIERLTKWMNFSPLYLGFWVGLANRERNTHPGCLSWKI